MSEAEPVNFNIRIGNTETKALVDSGSVRPSLTEVLQTQ